MGATPAIADGVCLRFPLPPRGGGEGERFRFLCRSEAPENGAQPIHREALPGVQSRRLGAMSAVDYVWMRYVRARVA